MKSDLLSICIFLFSSFSLAFGLKETNGPFNIFGKVRNYLLNHDFYGVSVYLLLECYYCLGFWSSFIMYLLNFVFVNNFTQAFVYSMCGAMLVLLASKVTKI